MKLMKLLTLKMFAFTAIFLSFCANAADQPYRIDAPDNPQKIVTYDIGVLDTLDALGIKAVGVPDKLYVDYLNYDDATVVGTLFETDMEALSALKPDWIIVAHRSAKHLNDLQQIAPTSDLSLEVDNIYQDAIHRLTALSKIFKREQQADEIAKRLYNLRDEIKENSSNAGKVLTLLVSGPKISVYGESSRAGWLKNELGFELIGGEDNASAHGEPVSFEYIAKMNPDWLFVIDRAAAIGQNDVASAASVLDNELVAQTTAWKNNQVIYLDSADLYIAIGGVQALEHLLQTIKQGLDK